MDSARNQQVRGIVYSITVLVILVGGVIFYVIWRDNQLTSNQPAPAPVVNKYAGQKLDTAVLNDVKLRELTPVVVEEETATSGTSSVNLSSPDKIKKILREAVRRYGNPFKAFSL